MVDLYLTRLQEITVVLYALSILLYFIDFLHSNRKANQLAFWLLAFVWMFQTVSFILYMLYTGRFPILTVAEGLYFYVWVLITLSLLISRIVKVEFIVFFTNVLGFIMIAIHTFAPTNQSPLIAEQLISELLFIHVTMAILSYGAFTISFIFSTLYLIQYDLLKKKKWGKRLIRIADLSKLEFMSNLLNVIGIPMLLLSLILGLRWAYLMVPGMIWYDMKVIGSFIIIFVYSFLLYMRNRKDLQGRALARWNAASFLIVLINFFLFGKLSSFHFWHS